jgi:hypothetical protein
MLSMLLEFALAVGAAAYLGYQVASFRRRRKLAWEMLSAQLWPDCPGPELLRQLQLKEEGSTPQAEGTPQREDTPSKRWRSTQSAGLWSMYSNAGVMIEIADFVDHKYKEVDREILAAIRNDAMQIRACALVEITKYARSEMNEGTIANVARVAAAYADMWNRTTQLLEGNRAEAALGFANAIQ